MGSQVHYKTYRRVSLPLNIYVCFTDLTQLRTVRGAIHSWNKTGPWWPRLYGWHQATAWFADYGTPVKMYLAIWSSGCCVSEFPWKPKFYKILDILHLQSTCKKNPSLQSHLALNVLIKPLGRGDFAVSKRIDFDGKRVLDEKFHYH